MAPLVSPGTAAPSVAARAASGAVLEHGRDVVGQVVGLHAFELPGDGEQRVAERLGAEDAEQQVRGADLVDLEHEGGEHPGALGGFLDHRGEILDGGGAAGQAVECGGEVGGQAGGIELVVLGDAVQVAIGGLQDLMEPVDQLDIGVAAELAEDGGALDGAVGEGVELSEQGGPADLGHSAGSRWWAR